MDQSHDPCIADHPNKQPQLKVMPKINCGQYVILFIRGYIITKPEKKVKIYYKYFNFISFIDFFRILFT